jgi:fermentation-respiration switch protein FrsA (DUF1100 family)
MIYIYWAVFAVVFLFLVNLIFYRVKGVDLFQLPLQFPPTGKGISSDKEASLELQADVEKKWINLENGEIECWLLSDDLKRSSIIFAHGNTGYIDTNLMFARMIQALGYHVLLVEYPGYGRSSGKPSEESITEGFSKAFDWLVSLPNVGNVAGYGNSLGSSIIARLSNERPLDLLILKSGVASFARLISKKVFIPERFVVNPFNSLGYVALYKMPVLLLHGKADPIVLYENAVALNNAALNSELVSFDGDHDSPNEEETLEQLQKFFQKHSF